MTPTNDASIVNIPKCCLNGEPDCPHSLDTRTKIKKTNIGM